MSLLRRNSSFWIISIFILFNFNVNKTFNFLPMTIYYSPIVLKSNCSHGHATVKAKAALYNYLFHFLKVKMLFRPKPTWTITTPLVQPTRRKVWNLNLFKGDIYVEEWYFEKLFMNFFVSLFKTLSLVMILVKLKYTLRQSRQFTIHCLWSTRFKCLTVKSLK